MQVHVIAGFLGSGKTTLLAELLRRRPAAERVGLIVNDFGTGQLDATALGAYGELRAIAAACVCCTAPAGFAAAVRELLDAGIERLFVEPTGLAVPADLIDTLRRLPFRERLTLGPLVVVVDPERIAADAAVRAQAEVADVLVINRTDLASPAALAATDAWLDGLWPGPAQVHRTVRGQVSDAVLEPVAPRGAAFRLPSPASADALWEARTLGWAPEVRLGLDAVRAALAAPDLDRAKGLLRTDEGWVRVERAGVSVDVAPTGWRRDGRLDAIARLGSGALDRLDAALAAAVLPDAASEGVEVVTDEGRTVWDRARLAALPGGLPDVGAVVPGRVGAAAPLAALLAGVPDDAQVVVSSVDGLVTAPTPAAALRAGWLAYALGDGPLPEKQGGPYRMLLPPGVASPCANVKAVARLRVRAG